MKGPTTSNEMVTERSAALSVGLPPAPRWRRWFWAPVKALTGAALMQSPAGGLVVLGWLQRYLQRAVYRGWWKRSPDRSGTFETFAAGESMLHGVRQAPNWILAQNFGSASGPGSERGGGRRVLGALAGSLGANLCIGLQTLMNLWALTMPGAVLWWVGWWGGWQNSFHKGYEQAMVGPLVSWIGILFFIAAMFYVPMAMGRQAVTGNWRSFWEGRTIWNLVRTAWLPTVCVAALFAGANVLAMGLKSWPQFLPQAMVDDLEKRGLSPTEAFERGAASVDWSNLTDPQALHLLNQHYFWSALGVFVLLITLRRAVAWLYSGSVLRAVQRGVLGEEQLADTEWRVLHTLGLLRVAEAPIRPMLVRFVAWAGTKVGRGVCASVTFVLWFAFVGAIYTSEFLTAHPVVGWLNQPLVQLPWFRYIPPQLENPAPALLAAMGLGVVVFGVGRWRRRRRPFTD